MKRAVLLFALAAGCGRTRPGADTTYLVLESPHGERIDPASVRVEPAGAAKAVTISDGLAVVALVRSAGSDVAVHVKGDCPARVPADLVRRGGTVRVPLAPWLEFGPELPEVGFDTEFRIAGKPGCSEAASTSVEWKAASRAPLRDVRAAARDRTFSARTPGIDSALAASNAWGIVPISPRTRGEAEILARFSCDGEECAVATEVAASARSRGLPNVAVGTRIYLRGTGWHLASAPVGTHAALARADRYVSLAPDVRGAFVLEDETGRALRLTAGKYDETPLDCGKSGCHTEIARAQVASPMATVLQRGLDTPFAGDYPGCAVACHTVGEPGTDDGGFVAILTELGRAPSSLHHRYDTLPAALRRLGGVGCLACHGPGAIPEETARFSILRADVCATCHDAPPRYGHVAAWRESSMARADRDPETRAPECARCHTTWGFLERPAARPSDPTAAFGIACAACHSVHPANASERRENAPPMHDAGARKQASTALLRNEPLPPLLAGAIPATATPSRICMPCHAASPKEGTPAASAALIWAGRGGVDPVRGEPITGEAVHLAAPGGCIGCHRSGPDGVDLGRGHAFFADPATCSPCHANKPRNPVLSARARTLWESLTRNETGAKSGGAPQSGKPLHAREPARVQNETLSRARWDVALVLEDPGADQHNPRYAAALLDAAERAIAGTRAGSKPSGGHTP